MKLESKIAGTYPELELSRSHSLLNRSGAGARASKNFSALGPWCSSFHHFEITETVPNQPSSYLKTCSRSSKGYNPPQKTLTHRRSMYCSFSQVESKINFQKFVIYGCRGHDKTRSATSVYRKLRMNDLYTQVPQVYVFLISADQKGTIKMVLPAYELICVWMGKCYVGRWIEICPKTWWKACKGLEEITHMQ